MSTYLIGLVLSVIIATIFKKNSDFKKNKFLIMFICILPLTLISAFRYAVGWDYFTGYVEGFNYYIVYNKARFSEQGFMYLIKIISFFTNNYQYLFIVTSVIIAFFFSMCFTVYGKKEDIIRYIILYFITRYYFCSLNIIRQAIAMLIVLYALHYLIDKKYLKYIIFILLASSFHKFSIIFLILFPFLRLNYKYKRNILIILFVIPLIVFVTFNFLSISGYSKYFLTMFGNDGSFAISELFISLILVIFSSVVYKKEGQKKELYHIFYNMELITLIFGLLSPFLPTIDRIIWYFSVQNIFFIPMIYDRYSNKNMRFIIKIIIYALLITICINQTIITDSFDINPYNSFLKLKGGNL